MGKYTLFLLQIGRNPMDGGGRLIPLKALTLPEASAEAVEHLKSSQLGGK